MQKRLSTTCPHDTVYNWYLRRIQLYMPQKDQSCINFCAKVDNLVRTPESSLTGEQKTKISGFNEFAAPYRGEYTLVYLFEAETDKEGIRELISFKNKLMKRYKGYNRQPWRY